MKTGLRYAVVVQLIELPQEPAVSGDSERGDVCTATRFGQIVREAVSLADSEAAGRLYAQTTADLEINFDIFTAPQMNKLRVV